MTQPIWGLVEGIVGQKIGGVEATVKLGETEKKDRITGGVFVIITMFFPFLKKIPFGAKGPAGAAPKTSLPPVGSGKPALRPPVQEPIPPRGAPALEPAPVPPRSPQLPLPLEAGKIPAPELPTVSQPVPVEIPSTTIPEAARPMPMPVIETPPVASKPRGVAPQPELERPVVRPQPELERPVVRPQPGERPVTPPKPTEPGVVSPEATRIPEAVVEKHDPGNIRFSQNSAGGKGRADVLRGSMGEKGWAGDPIDAVRTPEGITSIDNTRVAVARELKIKEIPVRVHAPNEPLPPDMIAERRFGDAKTWGEALEHRTSNQKPPLPSTGTIDPPRMPKPKN